MWGWAGMLWRMIQVRGVRMRVFVFWCVLASAAGFRAWSSFTADIPSVEGCLRSAVHGEGFVSVEPERKEGGQVFVVDASLLQHADGHSCIGARMTGDALKIRMKAPLYPRISFGESVEFAGSLSAPFNFRSESGREFNYQGFLAKDGIFFEIKSADIRLISDARLSPRSALLGLKRRFVDALERALGEPHAALAAGLVVGEKSALGKDLLDDFRRVGLIHIVVLSGYNITIVADALRRILLFLPRAWGIAAGAAGIGLFGILVGGGATVVRSCLMAGVALSADLIRRDYDVSRALIVAGLAMLIQNPLILLYDPSFQLSFLATLALILLAEPFERLLPFMPERFGIRGIVASTLATQVFVSPYILYMMGQISIIGMVVNILVLPFIPLTMLAVFATGAVGCLPGVVGHSLSQPIGWVAHGLLSYELSLVETFARVPLAAIEVPKFSGWIVIVAYAALALVVVAIGILRRRAQRTLGES